MWSIHPKQIRPIVAAFQPDADEVEEALAILDAAARAGWAPIQHGQVLHDRASYRYFWRVLVRAARAPAACRPTRGGAFSAPGAARRDAFPDRAVTAGKPAFAGADAAPQSAPIVAA